MSIEGTIRPRLNALEAAWVIARRERSAPESPAGNPR